MTTYEEMTEREKMVAYLETAEKLIDSAIDLMSPEQVGKWGGVRTWQETYGDFKNEMNRKGNTESNKLEKLLDAVEDVCNSWEFPDGQYGAPESFVRTESVIRLQKRFMAFLEEISVWKEVVI